jgi:tight adherence protein C
VSRSASRCSSPSARHAAGADAARDGAGKPRHAHVGESEKKAAALLPKLTVPMILFFLPVLFIVILGPAAIRVMAIQ